MRRLPRHHGQGALRLLEPQEQAAGRRPWRRLLLKPKTILRKNLEDRVLSCLPAAFFGMGVFDDIATEVRRNLAASIRNEPDERQQISGALKAAEQEQRQIIQQISDRAAEGRPRLAALDAMLYRIEERRAGLEARLNQAPEVEDFGGES